jgi:hypothetical protein
VAAGGEVRFRLASPEAGEVRVFDLGGREIGRAELWVDGLGASARWAARDRNGEPLPSGFYFARAGRHTSRITVIRR